MAPAAEGLGSRRWERDPRTLWRRPPGEVVVLLPPGADEPVALRGTGARLWDLLAQPRSTDDLAGALAGAYDADPAVVRRDCARLLTDLAAAGALRSRP